MEINKEKIIEYIKQNWLQILLDTLIIGFMLYTISIQNETYDRAYEECQKTCAKLEDRNGIWYWNEKGINLNNLIQENDNNGTKTR